MNNKDIVEHLLYAWPSHPVLLYPHSIEEEIKAQKGSSFLQRETQAQSGVCNHIDAMFFTPYWAVFWWGLILPISMF